MEPPQWLLERFPLGKRVDENGEGIFYIQEDGMCLESVYYIIIKHAWIEPGRRSDAPDGAWMIQRQHYDARGDVIHYQWQPVEP
jgi:hypothetical protein